MAIPYGSYTTLYTAETIMKFRTVFVEEYLSNEFVTAATKPKHNANPCVRSEHVLALPFVKKTHVYRST